MQELNTFKTEINFPDFLIEEGYTKDVNREGCRNYPILIKDDDMLVVTQSNGHWTYFNKHNDGDKGTIIDYIQRRQHISLGHVRKILRPYINSGSVGYRSQTPSHSAPASIPSNTFNRETINKTIRESQSISSHPYLTSRKIPTHIQSIYKNTIRNHTTMFHNHAFNNVLFPHRDTAGFCGGEVRNHNFKSCLPNSRRGIWYANQSNSTAIIITESAIDSLSYAALYPSQVFTLISIAGALSEYQVSIFKRLKTYNMPIHIATDADKSGDLYAEKLKDIFPNSNRIRPPEEGMDWNDILRQQ